MNFIDTTPGPFDLTWRMFGTPVRVKVTFWLFMALFGQHLLMLGFVYLVMWVLAGFLSVLVHEMGHITAGRIFGYPGTVILYAFGGGAVGEYGRAKGWQRAVIAASGPLAGFLFFLAVYFAAPFLVSYAPRLPLLGFAADDPSNPRFVLPMTAGFLLFMNLFWTAMNLAPIMPLDGGMVMKEAVLALSPRGGLRLAAILSVAAGIAVAGFFLYVHNTRAPYLDRFFEFCYPPTLSAYRRTMSPDPLFAAILYGLMAFQNLPLAMSKE